jgi:hypothetical protein
MALGIALSNAAARSSAALELLTPAKSPSANAAMICGSKVGWLFILSPKQVSSDPPLMSKIIFYGIVRGTQPTFALHPLQKVDQKAGEISAWVSWRTSTWSGGCLLSARSRLHWSFDAVDLRGGHEPSRLGSVRQWERSIVVTSGQHTAAISVRAKPGEPAASAQAQASELAKIVVSRLQ